MTDYKVTLKAARVNAGLTQTQVAEKLHISKQSLVNWENGITYPNMARLMTLLELYRCPIDCLFLPSDSTLSGGESDDD